MDGVGQTLFLATSTPATLLLPSTALTAQAASAPALHCYLLVAALALLVATALTMALEGGPPSSGRPGGEAVAGQVEKDTTAPDLPHGWPSDVMYLASHSMPVEGLPASLCLHLCTAPKPSHPSHPAQARARAWTEIRLVTAQTAFQPAYGSSLTTHPTLGQFGLFARRDIPPHTLVVPYLGRVHLASEEDASSRYDAAVESSDGVRLGIDATRAGNEARCVYASRTRADDAD